MKYVMYLLSILLLSSCLAEKNDIELAQRSSEKYYDFMKAKKVDSIIYLCDKIFFAETDTSILLGALNSIQSDHGNIVSHQLIRTETTNSIDNGKTENKLVLTYQAVYSSGYTAKESFRFYIEKGYTGKIGGFRTEKWKDK